MLQIQKQYFTANGFGYFHIKQKLYKNNYQIVAVVVQYRIKCYGFKNKES